MLNEIQQKILTKILSSDGLRYSEAYPGEEIDDDLYNYHLQQLVKNSLVKKENGKYELTVEGRVQVQMLDAKGRLAERFRVSVLLYVIVNNKVLMCRRTRWPIKGDVASPSGKVKQGEKIIDAAKRKLLEETGLIADFELKGVLRSARKSNGIWVEDTIYHVCETRKVKGELKEKSDFGEFFWATIEEEIEFNKSNKAGSKAHEEIINRLISNNKEIFYIEEILELNQY